MKKIVSLILAAVMVVAFAAGCSTAKVDGKYVVKSIDGKTVLEYMKEQSEESGIELSQLLEFMGITEDKVAEFMVVELNADKTAKMSMLGSDAVNGTWEQNGNKVTITVEGEDPAEFTYKNGELTYKMTEGEESHELVLIKAPVK